MATQKERLQKEVNRLNILIKKFEMLYKDEKGKFIIIKERLSNKIDIYKSIILNMD